MAAWHNHAEEFGIGISRCYAIDFGGDDTADLSLQPLPRSFECPITQEVMIDPIVTVDGHCYERQAIRAWFQRGNTTSPVTNLPLHSQAVVPCDALRAAIEAYLKHRPEVRKRELDRQSYEAAAERLQADLHQKQVERSLLCDKLDNLASRLEKAKHMSNGKLLKVVSEVHDKLRILAYEQDAHFGNPAKSASNRSGNSHQDGAEVEKSEGLSKSWGVTVSWVLVSVVILCGLSAWRICPSEWNFSPPFARSIESNEILQDLVDRGAIQSIPPIRNTYRPPELKQNAFWEANSTEVKQSRWNLTSADLLKMGEAVHHAQGEGIKVSDEEVQERVAQRPIAGVTSSRDAPVADKDHAPNRETQTITEQSNASTHSTDAVKRREVERPEMGQGNIVDQVQRQGKTGSSTRSNTQSAVFQSRLTELMSSAEQNNAHAQTSLATMYVEGRGVTQDYKVAAGWYQKAAVQGNPRAQTNLGLLYYGGQIGHKDFKVALSWYQKAAESGHSDAQMNLGLLHESGQGITKNYKTAAEWYRKAAEQGHPGAQTDLGMMYARGRGVKQDYSLTMEWTKKAAEQGYARAQMNLGSLYAESPGPKKDYNNAARWYRKAAEQGNAIAQSILDTIKKQHGELYDK